MNKIACRVIGTVRELEAGQVNLTPGANPSGDEISEDFGDGDDWDFDDPISGESAHRVSVNRKLLDLQD